MKRSEKNWYIWKNFMYDKDLHPKSIWNRDWLVDNVAKIGLEKIKLVPCTKLYSKDMIYLSMKAKSELHHRKFRRLIL